MITKYASKIQHEVRVFNWNDGRHKFLSEEKMTPHFMDKNPFIGLQMKKIEAKKD